MCWDKWNKDKIFFEYVNCERLKQKSELKYYQNKKEKPFFLFLGYTNIITQRDNYDHEHKNWVLNKKHGNEKKLLSQQEWEFSS
jgi:hypothetical protein